MEEQKKITTITISEEVWNYLNKEKNLGEGFNDTLKRLLEIKEDEDD